MIRVGSVLHREFSALSLNRELAGSDGSLKDAIMTPWHKELQSFANNCRLIRCTWPIGPRLLDQPQKRFRTLAIYLLLILRGGEDILLDEFPWYNSVVRRTEIEAVQHCVRTAPRSIRFVPRSKRTCQDTICLLEGLEGLSTQRKMGFINSPAILG